MFQKIVVQKIETHYMFNNFFPENRVIHDIMCKDAVQPDRPHTTIKYGAEWTAARIDTHTLIVYTIYCFSAAKLLRERVSILRYTHIACLLIALV